MQYLFFEFTIVFRPKGRPPHFRASNYETISIIRSLVLLFRWRGLLYYIYIQIPHTHTLTHLHYTHNRHLLLPVSSGLLGRWLGRPGRARRRAARPGGPWG